MSVTLSCRIKKDIVWTQATFNVIKKNKQQNFLADQKTPASKIFFTD